MSCFQLPLCRNGVLQSVLRRGQLHTGLEVGSEAESQASPPWYKAAMNTDKGSGALAGYKGWRNQNWPRIAPVFSEVCKGQSEFRWF